MYSTWVGCGYVGMKSWWVGKHYYLIINYIFIIKKLGYLKKKLIPNFWFNFSIK